MTTTAIMLAPLRGQPTLLTATTPNMGAINLYDATSGPMAVPLPQLGTLTIGAIVLLEKVDASANPVTFTCYAGDTFSDAATTLTLTDKGMQRTLQVISLDGGVTLHWKVIGGNGFSKASVRAAAKIIVTRNDSPSSIQLGIPGADGTRFDVLKIASLANPLNFAAWYGVVGTSPPDETPVKVVIYDNGTSQPLTFDSQYGVLGAIGALPTCTPGGGKRMTMQFVYDATLSHWILTAADTVGYIY